MNQSKVAIRYAKSFLSLAKEKGSVNETREDMEMVNATIKGSRDLRNVLQSPVIKADKKLDVVQKIFAGKIGEISQRFLTLIIEKGRDGIVPDIAEQYIVLCKEEDGIYDAYVTSAYALTDKQREHISGLAGKIQEGKIEIHETTDQSLIGGFVLRIGDQMIDASLKRQLRNMRQELIDNSFTPGL